MLVRLVVAVLALVGFVYLLVMGWLWVKTDGFLGDRGVHSSEHGQCTHVVLASSVSWGFSKIAEHERRKCEDGLEEHFLWLRPVKRLGPSSGTAAVFASNEFVSGVVPDVVLPLRLYWVSDNTLRVQYQRGLNFSVESIDGVEVESSRFLID
ncbi:MAG: hypothetical protein ACPGSC_09020 [Granulosicoccaceae bacterium]